MENNKLIVQNEQNKKTPLPKILLIASLALSTSFIAGCSEPRSYIETSLNSRDAGYRGLSNDKPLYTASIKKSTYKSSNKNDGYINRPRHYIVSKDDTLSGISYKHGVSVRSLAGLNRLRDDRIHAGQHLVIPTREEEAASKRYNDDNVVTASLKKRQYTNYNRHAVKTIIVQRDETLYGLSIRHGVSVNELAAINDLSGYKIKAGQRLKVPSQRHTRSRLSHRQQVAYRQKARVEKTSYRNDRYDEPVETGSIGRGAKRITNDEIYARHIMKKGPRYVMVGSNDTLSGISYRYKMPARSIMAANRLESDKIYYGQKLIIPNSCEPFCIN